MANVNYGAGLGIQAQRQLWRKEGAGPRALPGSFFYLLSGLLHLVLMLWAPY